MRLLLTILVVGVIPFILLRKMGRNGRRAPGHAA
jgi:hypothetical protein